MAQKRFPYNKARALALTLSGQFGVSVWRVAHLLWPQASLFCGSSQAIEYGHLSNSGKEGWLKLPDSSIMSDIF